MHTTQHNELELQGKALKPFRLVKYFSVASFVVILVATILLSFFFFQRDKSMLLKRNEEFAVLLAENLNHQVFQKFVMPTALVYGKMSLRDPKQYNLLDKVVRGTTYGFNVERVVIYSHDDLMVYSTEYTIDQMLEKSRQEGPFGLSIKPDEHYLSALRGRASSLLETTGSIASLLVRGDRGDGVRLLSTYAPFRVDLTLETKSEKVIGVLKITQDITVGYLSILKNQTLTIAIFIVVMTFLFVSLLLIVHRAQRIIHRRAEEKKRLEEQLNHAERLAGLGQMVAGVSHEIRNPLGIIRSTGEMLAQRMEKYEPGNRLSQVIVEESTRLDRIVTEFLDFARPQVPNPVPYDLRQLILRNLEVLEPESNRFQIEIQTSLQADLEPIHIDPNLMYRGLLNVFNNAIQSMPDGGKMRVSLSNGMHAGVPVQTVQVEDTGDGVPAETLKHIFQPFFTTREKGTGLGLSIVKNIVEGHGGWIDVESPVTSDLNPSRDRGTRFTIILPMRRESIYQ
ncbi:MAG: two-component sensor histidine kinase [Deltaproteobacteria bacterium]|nr:two-component sensor histidine kinase [Deltaproteobacteria bacterium]